MTTQTVEEVKLIRKPLEVAGLKSLTEESLMAEVKEVLGYSEVDKAVELRKAAAILKELDIEPFENSRVEAYKRAEAKRITKTYRDSWGNTRQSKGYWKATPLRDYKKHVPGFALIRATEIKKAMNAAGINADFVVEELSRRTKTIVVDPFMILHVAGKKLYIDVWNEPKFEGRRTK